MSAPPITGAHLRAVDPAAFARGDAYFRDGRVLECRAAGGALDGTVRGSGAPYRVRVELSGGALRSACTCPIATGMCKHAVALVLHHLAAGPAPAAGEAAPGDVFADAPALAAFAAAHRVRHLLPLAADALIDDLPGLDADRHWLRPMLARFPLRDLGSLAGMQRHHARRDVQLGVARAARRRFEREAAAIRDGLAEAAARPAAPPDAATARLWQLLASLHAALCAGAEAAPRGRAGRAGAWSFDAAACAITWQEPGRLFRTGEWGTAPIAARLAFAGPGEQRFECTCRAAGAGCTHTLALLDATLDALADPARAAEARALAEEVLRPRWERALRELDALEAHSAAAAARAPIEVWWQLDDDDGRFALAALVRKPLKRGGLSKGARLPAARLLEEHGAELDERDRRVAEELAAWAAIERAGAPRGLPSYPVRALLALAGHPRVTATEAEAAGHARVEVRRAALGFHVLEAGAEIRIEPALEGERLPPRLLAELLDTFAPGEPLTYLDAPRGRCLLVDVAPEARRLWEILARHGEAFPADSRAALLDRLARLEARVPLAVPASLKGTELAIAPATVVRLRLAPGAALEAELFVRPAPGAPLWHPGEGPRELMMPAPGGARGYVKRDLAAEPDRARAHLAQLPLADAVEGPPWCFSIADPDAALAVVAAADPPPPDLEIEWVDIRPRIARPPGIEALRVQIEEKRDWFGITGELRLEQGRLELAVVLDAARRQQRFVRVGDDRWVELSEALRRHLRALADQTYAGRGRLELSPGAVPAVRDLAEAGAHVRSAPGWRLATERLAAAAALRPRPPAALAATLRDYQIEGHAWLSRVAAWGAGACLADDMGLGKTVQAIAVLLDRARLGPALVIAPTSVTFNWIDELRRFAPTLRPVLYTEQSERAAALATLKKKDVLVASYGLLVRDAAPLAARPFATLVLDEAQALKNPTTQRAKAARALDAGFRLALTGTPLENHLGELWSLYSIVFPGLLGSWEQFRERFATPIERGGAPEAQAALARVLRPFLLRRTKAEVARELPPRIEIQLPVVLSPEEQALYDDARLAAVAALTARGDDALGDEQRRFEVLAALTRLRLLACHPRLHDPTSKLGSSKLARLLELTAELRSEGHRALVFSQFTSHLALVRGELERSGLRTLYLDGSTPARERAALIRAFQGGEGDLFLISLKAGGTGLNLTAADYVIHLDPWWNPAVEDQASDRAHRIGQTRPVTICRLVARGTIEEQILSLHRHKRALVAGVLEGTDAAARLSTRDLIELLREGGAR